jgi:uncharacterized protein YnzC (UPF0291/DUF896 family)
MVKEKIDRINELAKKAKSPQGLTDAEKQEQTTLRAEYIAEFRASFASQLDHTVIQRPDGTKEALKKNGSHRS